MNTKKSSAKGFLESVRGRPLTFGKMLESIRLADEITQVNLAKRLGVSKAHLCDIEKGRRLVSVEKAAQFAKILGYSVNQFVALSLEDQLRKAGMSAKVQLKAA